MKFYGFWDALSYRASTQILPQLRACVGLAAQVCSMFFCTLLSVSVCVHVIDAGSVLCVICCSVPQRQTADDVRAVSPTPVLFSTVLGAGITVPVGRQ